MTTTPQPTPDIPREPDHTLAAIAADAAQCLYLGSARRVVYLGDDGHLLAAFCEAWPSLEGDWLGPLVGQAPAQGFLELHGLGRRIRYTVGERVDALPAADLLLCCALDLTVDETLRRLVSARAGWLAPRGRCLVLRRRSPHLSSVVGAALLHGQCMRPSASWDIAGDVVLVAAVPALAPNLGAGPSDAVNTGDPGRELAA